LSASPRRSASTSSASTSATHCSTGWPFLCWDRPPCSHRTSSRYSMALEALQSSPDADEHLAERDAQRMWGQGGIPDLMRGLRGLPYLSESLPQRDVEYVLIHLHNSEILPFARHRHPYPRETTGTTRISERVNFKGSGYVEPPEAQVAKRFNRTATT